MIGGLRFGHARRRPRARYDARRGRIPGRVSIHGRPPEIEERLVPGHWADDFIKGAHHRPSVGTRVERTTLFTRGTLADLDNATAEATLTGARDVLNRIEAQKRLSLTYGQGCVFPAHQRLAAHPRLTGVTGVKVYCADPHSPWQRGINENTNGLLRQ